MTIEVDFSPVVFLRCHSKNKDSADVQTQVWQCAFEPLDENSDTSVVATCGGNSVCFVDCSNGKVISKYYSHSLKELFFSLAWTTLNDGVKRRNILVTGGALSTLHFISRSVNDVLCVEPLNIRSKTIHSLFFHPSFKDTLFCGVSNGEIRILRLKYLPSEVKISVDHCSILRTDSEIFDITISSKLCALFSSCDAGLFCFKIDDKPFTTKARSPVKLILPKNPNSSLRGSTSLVDSVETLNDDTIAVKCALHGRIYICQLDKELKGALEKGVSSVNITPTFSLIWSNTDNYFMYQSFSKGSSLLSCGDDKGNIWLYDLGKVLKCPPKGGEVNPVKILPWPLLTDHHNDKKRKLKLDVYDIVIDKVALHSSALYLVAVTNNNMVCIWKKN